MTRDLLRSMRILLSALALLALLAPMAVLVPPSATAAESRSCAWIAKVDPTAVNVLYPDEAASYWVFALPLVRGETIVLRGKYPHSRYFSFTSYDPLLRSADGLHDSAITPDLGSTNPFLPRADRTASRRAYTVTVRPGDRPETAAPNALFTGSQDGTRSNPGLAVVIYRNYLPDAGLGVDGGVGLPSVSVRSVLGEVEMPACAYPTVPDSDLNQMLAALSPPVMTPPLIGSPTPQWTKFVNLPTAVANFATTSLTDSLVSDLLTPVTTTLPSGGFADNPDNKYISTVLSSSYGDVAVIQGTMPTFPSTYQGQRRLGDAQMRYWSMCSEEFVSSRYYDCLVDEEVPLGPGRTFTIMVSTAENRPANATPECGIAWLPMGPAPDTVMILRNMLPALDFPWSIQQARPGHEQEDLGRYYPVTRYHSLAEAEALGCSEAAR